MMYGQLLILSRNLESTNLILRPTKVVVVLQGILIINVLALINDEPYIMCPSA